MAAFVRRFPTDPDEATLLAIEGVVIVDGAPVSQIRGTGTGTVLVACETEDGPFCAEEGAVEVLGSMAASGLGGFGFTYAGVASQYPCCRARSADSAATPETWNGSGFVQLKGCKFKRLFIARVDTSVGSVAFSRLASLSGNTSPSWNLEPAQTLVLSIDGGGDVTVTFDAAVATILSADGSFPYAPAGGETLVFKIDGTTYTATFTAGDTTHTLMVARLNAAAGSTRFVESTLKTRINGIIRGTSGSVQIVSGTASALTALGFTAAAAVAGTGDVADIDLVTDAEVTARVLADSTSAASVDRDSANRIRIFSLTGLTGTIKVKSTSTATAFGWTTDTTATAVTGVAGTIPAGTRVSASGSGQMFVTMQTIAVTAASAGPYAVKVRHAEDDQTGTAEIAAAVDTVYAPISLGAFSVTNDLPVTVALTDAQIDAAYEAALDKTKGTSSPVKQANYVLSARQSNTVRAALRQNALDASAGGCFGRMSIIRPPLGITKASAMSDTQPGVGAYREQGNFYAYPGVQKKITEIAAVGTAGGTGFTADGIVNAGADFAVACLCSQLNPEEDIGQETTGIVDWVLGVESGNTDVADLTIDDYIAFKAAGIMAVRVDGSVTIQSAVTSVDATLYPALVPANRRRFSYFYQDSVSQFSRAFVKKLQTKERRALLVARFNSFAGQLVSDSRAESKLIDGSAKAGNTPESLARNVFITIHKIRSLPTFGVIELKTEIGNDVVTTEL